MQKPLVYEGLKFTHNRTCDEYTTVEGTLAKFNGEWHQCVVYRNGAGEKFVRTIDDFKASFTKVE